MIEKNYIIQGRGKGSAAQQSQLPSEEPNTLRSKSVLRIVEVLSEGEIEGLVDGAKSIYFDETPLQNSDNSFNFEGINYQIRNGLPDQAPVNGISEIETEFSVGVKVTQATQVVRTLADSDSDSVRVTLRFNALTSTDTQSGDVRGSSVTYRIWYQPSGGSYLLAKENTVTGKTTSQYEISHRIALTGNAPWNIKVERVTEDAPNSSVQNDMFFSSYTKIVERKMIYPDSALAGLSVDSSLFGSSIPTRSYEIKGIKIKVPTNYDPVTRSYTGIWNGTFKVEWSDNPAWVFYDLATNKRYGLGEFLEESAVDKFALYEIAQYCDQLIPDGLGGLRPRFTFNYQITQREDAYKLLQSLASSFRAITYWGAEGANGALVVIQDKPKDVTKLVTNANVIDGLFSYEGSAETARHSVVFVTWNDPSNGYKAEIEVVEDPTLIQRYGYRQVDIIAYGCTSKAQARMQGEWLLFTEANETEIVKYKASIDHADVRPGDIIAVSDSDYADIRYGGRIRSISGNQITLDAQITIEVGQTYILMIHKADGDVQELTITNSPGTYSVVTVDVYLPNMDDWADVDALISWDGETALSPNPIPYAVYIIRSSNLAPRQFRVLAVKEADPSGQQYEISALLHDPNKFDIVERDLVFEQVNFSNIRRGALLPPSNLTIREALTRKGMDISSKAIISYTPSPDGRVLAYELEARVQGQEYRLIDKAQSVSLEVENTLDGIWDFRVRAVNGRDEPSPWVYLNNQSLSINGSAPADVTGFGIIPLGDYSQLYWNKVPSLNVSHYEIRYAQAVTGASWTTAQVLQQRVPVDASSVQIPSREGTYFIKAVTIPTVQYPNGVYSINAPSIISSTGSVNPFNFVTNLVEDPSFSGVRTSCSVSGGILRLTKTGDFYPSEGLYLFNNSLDLGGVFTSRITADVEAAGEDGNSNVDLWSNVDEISNVDGLNSDQWGIKLQIRFSGDALSNPSAVWSSWQDFQVADYSARSVQFRLFLYSYNPNITPAVSRLRVTVDMPDLVQSANSLTSLTSGNLAVTFSKVFKSPTPDVVITPMNLQTGDYWTITSVNESGFNISFFNAAGTRVARNFNYIARGYGFSS